MSGRQPFVNVMLVCQVPHGAAPMNVPPSETMPDPVSSLLT